MNIIYITASLPYGSAEPFSVPEIEGLRRLGHRVTVVPMHPSGQVIHVKNDWLEGVVTEGLVSPRIVWSMLKGIGKWRKQIVRAAALVAKSRNLGIVAKNALVFSKGVWLAEMAQRLRADHIHANWASCPATIGLVASELSGIPWSFTGHRVDIQGNNLLDLKAERATFVRFISESGRHLARSVGSTLAAEQAEVVHLGVLLPPRCTENRDAKAASEVPVVLCAANLYGLKAHEDLIHAVKILHSRQIFCELWLAGDGPLRKSLQQLVLMLDLAGSVKFLGQLPHDEIIAFYRSGRISCTVLASLIEGIPVSLMEAMSFGVPVVATGVGGIPELLGGGCGIIVPPRDPVALANGIAEVLTDDGVRVGLARAGRQRIEAEYSVEHNVKLLSELLANSGSVQREVPLLSRN